MAQEDVKTSRMHKGRKTINYLQKCKEDGIPLVQMCPGPRDQFWTMAAEMAGCDICRLTVPGDGSDPEMQIKLAPLLDQVCPERGKEHPHQFLHADSHLRLQGAGSGKRRYVHELRR